MENSKADDKRILVVEDELEITRVCIRTLVPEGYQVDTAGDGSVAEDMLKKKVCDLIFMDIRTPVVNGKQLYKHISEHYPGLVEGVIFTTGDITSTDTQQFLEQSGRPFLLKPFTLDELKSVVRETVVRLR
jgi:CheY-like chemotaxis protein